jgi:gliding motility-associated-like protein
MKIKIHNSYHLHSWRGLVILLLFLVPLGKQVMTGQSNALVLNGAYIIMDGGTPTSNIYMVVDQASTTAITRPGGGHINSEGQYNILKWVSGTNTGNYVFPFGVGGTSADYIPFTFNKTSASSSDLNISTWTTNQQNMPHPDVSNVAAVTNMIGVTDSLANAIDRFWDIQSPSVTGDLTFSYRGSENTTMFPVDTFKAQHWNGSSWDVQAGIGNLGVTTGIGTVGPVTGQSTFSPWVLDRAALKATVAGQNAICGTQCTATASITPLHGIATYSYSWSDGQTTAVASNLCVGTYTCLVTDSVHATTTVTVNVISNPLPTISSIASQTACAGTNVNAVNFSSAPSATVNWANTNTGTGLAANGTGNIGGYTAPGVGTQQTGVVTAIPVDTITGCIGNPSDFTLTINPTPNASGSPAVNTATCGTASGGVSGPINVTGGTSPIHYQWYNGSTPLAGDTLSTLSNVGGGTYSLAITDANGCVANGISTTFVVPSTASVTAGFSPSTSQGQAPLDVSFTNASTGASSYNWNLGNGVSTQQDPSSTYTTPGTYTVMLVASNGSCVDSVSTIIIVDAETSITIPNVFSPNGDGVNDGFFIKSTGMESLTCDIFNRWGQLVYRISSPGQRWDGTLNNGSLATDGTYFYILTAKGLNGKDYNSQGSLSLFR